MHTLTCCNMLCSGKHPFAISDEEYNRQLSEGSGPWICPKCGDLATCHDQEIKPLPKAVIEAIKEHGMNPDAVTWEEAIKYYFKWEGISSTYADNVIETVKARI